MLHRLRKFIPTDMMWDGTYPATGVVTVTGGNRYSVEIERSFPRIEDAVSCFNRLTVIRDHADIREFTGTRSGRYGNLLPYESTKLTPHFDEETHQWIEPYGDDFFLPTPLPWGRPRWQ